eukprot:GHUV01021790.1.p1 GENE.GHUV01021790.1~~GHUV01021790.1.p1  ORF type:complete len:236 (+),score=46.39 GHUV01021790.1:973-1680(+)
MQVTDLHRHFIDDITIPSSKGKGVLRRIDDVFDCWFESGSMPYGQVSHLLPSCCIATWLLCYRLAAEPSHVAVLPQGLCTSPRDVLAWKISCQQCSATWPGYAYRQAVVATADRARSRPPGLCAVSLFARPLKQLTMASFCCLQLHYPFENKELFENNFPADFVAEGLDQTRGWFYTLMVLSTALFDKPAFKNLVCNGLVLAADGKKMSKRLKNYPVRLAVLAAASVWALCMLAS